MYDILLKYVHLLIICKSYFHFFSWHINPCLLFNAKSFFYKYNKYMICKHIVKWSKCSISYNLVTLYKVECFQVLLCIINNLIKSHSLVYTLKLSKVLFLTIQFNISPFVWTQFKQFCELNYHDQKVSRTPTHDIREHGTAVLTLLGHISTCLPYLHH